MIIPGVQKPHWRAWHSWKASCTGCSLPSWAIPSMVVTSCPSAWTARTLQLFTLRPSRCTVHAPQLLVSQPITVPVFPSISRRYCTSSIRGSTSSETCAPSTVRLILVIEACLSRACAPQGPVVRVTLGRLRLVEGCLALRSARGALGAGVRGTHRRRRTTVSGRPRVCQDRRRSAPPGAERRARPSPLARDHGAARGRGPGLGGRRGDRHLDHGGTARRTPERAVGVRGAGRGQVAGRVPEAAARDRA